MLYGTGARISEAVGLDVDDVDLGHDHPEQASVLLRGKGGKERVVPLGSYAREALTDYLDRARSDLVSASPRAGVAGAMFLKRPWRPALATERLDRDHPGRRARRRHRERVAAQPAALLRDPPARTAEPTSGSSRSCSGTPR